MIVVLILLALFADFVAPHSPDSHEQMRPFSSRPSGRQGGSIAYPLGTDAIGRDMLSRLIYGARLSLLIGIAVVTLSLIAGTIARSAGRVLSRGVIEIAIMRLMDIMLTLPSLLLAIVIVAILGPGLMNAMLAVAIVRPAALRAHRARRRDQRSSRRITSPRPRSHGAGRLAADVPDGAAELPGAADRAGDARLFDRDPRRGRARLSRPRRAAADRPNGAPCWPTRANSCCAPGGW